MKQIYLADDEPVVRRIITMGLESAGYSVATAADGAECFKAVCQSPPDLLITDIEMPGMTGKELCLAIAQEFPTCPFPIVVLTGRTELEHRVWTETIKDICFMEKPVSIRRLVDHVENVLNSAAPATATLP